MGATVVPSAGCRIDAHCHRKIYRKKVFEMDYIRWIPGDPWEALLAVFVLGTDLGILLEITCRQKFVFPSPLYPPTQKIFLD